VDGDGQVNPVDSGLVQAAFGSADEADLCQYDVDCDGQINPVDSGIVQSLFGTCNAPRAACPPNGPRRASANNIVPDGFSARALSPPNFPDIRVADDFTLDSDCVVDEVHANIIEDDGWADGGDAEVCIYSDTGGAGPGAVLTCVTTIHTKQATGDSYFGRDDYDYFYQDLGINLTAGTYWLGVRNANGGGSGTNYWMTSDGGADGPTSDTGWFSLDAGGSWSAEGANWHHAFEIVP